MWLSLLMALLSYLMSPKDTAKERRQALTNAALVGGATYLATEYTDWGKNISTSFDNAIGVGDSLPNTDLTEAQAKAVLAGNGSVSDPSSKRSTGFWDTMTSWGPAGVSGVIATGAVATSSKFSDYLPWLLIGGAALFILK